MNDLSHLNEDEEYFDARPSYNSIVDAKGFEYQVDDTIEEQRIKMAEMWHDNIQNKHAVLQNSQWYLIERGWFERWRDYSEN